MKTDVLSKFSGFRSELVSAAEGRTDLRANRRLFKKVHKYYKAQGLIFTGDAHVDYNIIVNYLSDDLVAETY